MFRALRNFEKSVASQLVSLTSFIAGEPANLAKTLGPVHASFNLSRSVSHDALDFAKKRKKYESDLSDLRKRWLQEEKNAALKRAAVQEAVALRRETAKAQRARMDAASRDEHRQQALAKQQNERELRVLEKEDRLQRQEARNDILDAAREERYDSVVFQIELSSLVDDKENFEVVLI